MKRSEIFFSALMVPVDCLALLGAFILSYYLRDSFSLESPANLLTLADKLKYNPGTSIVLSLDQYLHYLSIIIPGMVVIFAIVGLYGIRSNLSSFQRFFNILIGVSMGEFFILFLFLLKKDFFLPRSTILYSWILGTLFVIVARALVRLVQRYLYRYGIGVVRVVVVGTNATAKRAAHQLSRSASSAYRLVSELDSLPIPELITHITKNNLDEVVVVSDKYSSEELIALRNACLEEHIGFSFIPALLTELESTFDIQTIGTLPMIEVNPTPLDGWGRVIKRLFDIVASLILIILFSPLFLAIVISLKLLSPGPLIYKHRRIGKNKQPIDIWKFRSMDWQYCTGAGYSGDKSFQALLDANPELAKEWEQTHKLKNDPRISLPGRILRTTSLDELPQLFNVLRGTLSLVGPRPIVQDEVRKYGEGARLLFTVKPGMTGLWQVSGRNDTSYDERIALDTRYIEHWNLLGDVSILLRTGLVVLGKSRGGAY